MAYAPGTSQFGDDRERRFRHQQTRAMNVSDIITGFGMVAQSLGKARRAQQEQADQAVAAERLGQMQAHPEGAPGELGPGGMGPATAPVPWEEKLGQEAGAYRPSTMFENIGRSFTEPFGIQETKGRLRPDAAVNLMGMAINQRAAARGAEHQGFMERARARELDIEEQKARAAAGQDQIARDIGVLQFGASKHDAANRAAEMYRGRAAAVGGLLAQKDDMQRFAIGEMLKADPSETNRKFADAFVNAPAAEKARIAAAWQGELNSIADRLASEASQYEGAARGFQQGPMTGAINRIGGGQQGFGAPQGTIGGTQEITPEPGEAEFYAQYLNGLGREPTEQDYWNADRAWAAARSGGAPR